ncbi:MAG TPA: hypothetical protein VIJ55_02135 [Acetobacteraceae bacterium]
MSEDGVGESLRRLEQLIAALDSVTDPTARESARALLEVVLDLHSVALARMTAMVASADETLLRAMADDDPVRAILLLHGLHPDDAETRVRAALQRLAPMFAARGLGLKLIACNATDARLRVRRLDAGPMMAAAEWRAEIEAAIVEAAPDLETLEIEGLDEPIAALAS